MSYGGVSGGLRSVQMTKLLLTTLKIVPIYEAVAIPFYSRQLDSKEGLFTPTESQEKAAKVMLDELLRWTSALEVLRK